MTTTCIDLAARFGGRYRITWDEAAGPRPTDPWLMQIPCQAGTIYPHGGDKLALELDYHRHLAKRVAAIPGVRLHQDGDHEKTFVFPSDLFDAVAAIVQPKRRRQLTPEQKQSAVDRLAKYQFRPAAQDQVTEPESTITQNSENAPLDGLEAL